MANNVAVAAPKITIFLVFLFTKWNFGLAACVSTPYPNLKMWLFLIRPVLLLRVFSQRELVIIPLMN